MRKLVISDIYKGLQGNIDSGWMERYESWHKAKTTYLSEVDEECSQAKGVPLKTKYVVHEINQVFGNNTILVNENGGQDLWTYYSPYYQVLDRNGCLAPGEQTLMGNGVMGAVGAKLACPGMKVVCVTGDGAFPNAQSGYCYVCTI